MRYWLMKSEPGEYSIDNLKRDRQEPWDGIRNYQVRNMIRDEMRPRDQALFYHSNAGTETGIVGLMEIVSRAYPDPTQFDPDSAHPDPKSDPNNPRWLCVDVRFKRAFKRIVTLPELRSETVLVDLPLFRRGNRLSIMSLTERQFKHIIKLADKKY